MKGLVLLLLALGATADVFYYVKRDFRKCAFPMCGGFFAWEANKDDTSCPRDRDDPDAASCYVAGASSNRLADSNVVLGSIARSNNPDFQRFPSLNVATAWRATAATPSIEFPTEVTFFKLSQNGLVCVTTPCFTMNADPLNADVRGNSRKQRERHTVSISDLGGEEKLVVAAQQELAIRTVMAAGSISDTTEGGKLFTITHLFIEDAAELQCETNEDCIFTNFHTLVTKRQECYCPACHDYAVSVTTATKNEREYNRFCARYRQDSCPLFKCLAAPEATCENGRCCCNRV